MTNGKLCTMNLNHLMNNINICVNSECIECKSYTECYTEFIQRHANYKKKKNSDIYCFTKVFDSRVNLISLRSDIDFGNHPNRTHFTDLFKSENLLSIRENGGILSPVQDYQSFLRGNFCIEKQKIFSLIHLFTIECRFIQVSTIQTKLFFLDRFNRQNQQSPKRRPPER